MGSRVSFVPTMNATNKSHAQIFQVEAQSFPPSDSTRQRRARNKMGIKRSIIVTCDGPCGTILKNNEKTPPGCAWLEYFGIARGMAGQRHSSENPASLSLSEMQRRRHESPKTICFLGTRADAGRLRRKREPMKKRRAAKPNHRAKVKSKPQRAQPKAVSCNCSVAEGILFRLGLPARTVRLG